MARNKRPTVRQRKTVPASVNAANVHFDRDARSAHQGARPEAMRRPPGETKSVDE